jgi:hypothetical protein
LSSSTTPKDHNLVPNQPHFFPARPYETLSQTLTPESITDSVAVKQHLGSNWQTSLKRNASIVSDMSSSSQPARKKVRRGEIPIFARSGRSKPVRLMRGNDVIKTSRPPTPDRTAVNGHAGLNGNGNQPASPVAANFEDLPWEDSIINDTPHQDLVRRVCDWIYLTIGGAEPPSSGAVFEIEAKIGEIHDIDEGRRLRLPVESETIFKKDDFRKTRFESSMSAVRNVHPLYHVFRC